MSRRFRSNKEHFSNRSRRAQDELAKNVVKEGAHVTKVFWMLGRWMLYCIVFSVALWFFGLARCNFRKIDPLNLEEPKKEQAPTESHSTVQKEVSPAPKKKGPIKHTPLVARSQQAPRKIVENYLPPIDPKTFLLGRWRLEGAGLEIDYTQGTITGSIGDTQFLCYDTTTDTEFKRFVRNLRVDPEGILVETSMDPLNIARHRKGSGGHRKIPRGVFRPVNFLFQEKDRKLTGVLMSNSSNSDAQWHKVRVIQSPLDPENIMVSGVEPSYKEHVTLRLLGVSKPYKTRWLVDPKVNKNMFFLAKMDGYFARVQEKDLSELQLPHPDSEINLVTEWGYSRRIANDDLRRIIIATMPPLSADAPQKVGVWKRGDGIGFSRNASGKKSPGQSRLNIVEEEYKPPIDPISLFPDGEYRFAGKGFTIKLKHVQPGGRYASVFYVNDKSSKVEFSIQSDLKEHEHGAVHVLSRTARITKGKRGLSRPPARAMRPERILFQIEDGKITGVLLDRLEIHPNPRKEEWIKLKLVSSPIPKSKIAIK